MNKKGYEMKSVHGGFDGDIHVMPDLFEGEKGTMTIPFYSGGGSAGRHAINLPKGFREMDYSAQRKWCDSISEKARKIVVAELKKADEKIMAQLKKNIKSMRD